MGKILPFRVRKRAELVQRVVRTASNLFFQSASIPLKDGEKEFSIFYLLDGKIIERRLDLVDGFEERDISSVAYVDREGYSEPFIDVSLHHSNAAGMISDMECYSNECCEPGCIWIMEHLHEWIFSLACGQDLHDNRGFGLLYRSDTEKWRERHIEVNEWLYSGVEKERIPWGDFVPCPPEKLRIIF